MSSENLVNFPGSDPQSVGRACAVFCESWRGDDVPAAARHLQTLLPPRVPGALQLAVARALGELDLPPFASVEEFTAVVRRFASRPPTLRDISDVRRARRESRVTLERIATDAALPVYIFRQLEWGDFRAWKNDDWTQRVTEAYAKAAGLDPVRVAAIVNAERLEQLDPAPAAPAEPISRFRPAQFAAAAAAIFAIGLGIGAVVTDSDPERTGPRPPTVITEDVGGDGGGAARGAPAAPVPLPAEPTTIGDPVAPRQPAPEVMPPPAQPQLRKATSGAEPTFSPAFASAGSAVFFHRDANGASALMKSLGDDTAGDLRIVSIVEDGAKNYHVRPSPDGTKIAFDSDRDGERGVYVANADGTAVQRVSGPGFAAVPSWSPDGRRLAFVRGEEGSRAWNLWLLDLQANTSVKLTSHTYGQPWGASWFADGKRVAYSHEDRLHVLDIESGARRVFRSPRAGRLLRTPAVSPDGRYVAFQVYRDGAWLLDLRDESMKKILADPTAEEFAWDATGQRLAFHSRRSGTWSVWVMSR